MPAPHRSVFYRPVVVLVHLFNNLFPGTTWVCWYWEGKTSLDLKKARDDGVLGMAAASAGPYANNIHLALDR